MGANKQAKGSAKKPYPDFPLFLHATGQWAKKVRGKLLYFGTDADEALRKWTEQRDDLMAGRPVRAVAGAVTVMYLVNRFLTSKKLLLQAGELSYRTFADYHDTGAILIDAFGKNRSVDTLGSEDFERLRAKLAKTRGPVALGNQIQRVRTIFKFAFDDDLIAAPVRFGVTFRKPSKRVMRQAKHDAGSRMIEATDLRRLIDQAGQPLRAIVLLGINCGFGQSDIAGLTLSAIDLDGGWVNYPRPKTGIARRCPLWPETIEAVRSAIATRPEPRSKSDSDLAFITPHGWPWVRLKPGKEEGSAVKLDAVGVEFGKLLRALELKRPGLNFYALRHCFRTRADAAKDGPAVDLIMGHADSTMGGTYREQIDDARLKAVVNVVHDWLWPSKKRRRPTLKHRPSKG